MHAHIHHLLFVAGLALAAEVADAQQPGGGEKRLTEHPTASRTDRYGDPLPADAVLRLGTLRHRYPDPLLRLPTLLPDGQTLLGGTREAVRWTDRATGRRIRSWPLPAGFRVEAFSPDGRLAAPSDGRTLRLRDFTAGKDLPFNKVLDPRPDREKAVFLLLFGFFSPDARTIVVDACVGHSRLLRVWNVASGRELWREGDLTAPARWEVLCFLPDGKTLLLADHQTERISLRDHTTGKERRAFATMPFEQFVSHALSPDGKTLLLGTRADAVRARDVTTGKELPPLEGHKRSARPAGFAPDAKTVLTVGSYNVIFVWDWPSGKLRRKIDIGPGPVYSMSVAASADGKRVELLRLGESALRIFDLETGREISPYPEAHRGLVGCIVTSPDGKLLSSSVDFTLRTWDLRSGRQVREFDIQTPYYPSQLSMSADGRMLGTAGGDKGVVELRNPDTGRLIRTIEADWSMTHALAISPSGRLIAANGTRFSGGGDTEQLLVVWDAETGKEVRRLEDVYSGGLAFAPDGRLLAGIGREGERVKVWDVMAGKVHLELPASSAPNVAFSPDGRTLAVADGEAIVLWEPASGKERARIQMREHLKVLHNEVPRFSPTGRWLASVNPQERVIRLHDSLLGRTIHTFVGHEGTVCGLAFSSGGQALASGSADTTILVWDVAGVVARQPQAKAPSDAAVAAAWDGLASTDARAAYRAIAVLVDAPSRSVPLIRERARPVPLLDTERVQRLLADLDSGVFAERERATRELDKLRDPARGALRRFLKGKPSAEAQRRAGKLLARADEPITDGAFLQQLRAVEVLEFIGSAEAQQVLGKLCTGAPEARLTSEAKASLARLAARP
jgi:WD40 repeat protein